VADQHIVKLVVEMMQNKFKICWYR